MKNLLRFPLLAPLLALLAGCCANNTCNCQDLPEDAIYFQLNQDPQRGNVFSDADIDTVYLLRYNKTRPRGGRALDSVALRRPLRRNSAYGPGLKLLNPRDTASLVILSNVAPFAPNGSQGKLSNFGYALVVAPYVGRGLPRPRYTFALDSVQLDGRYDADGCCTCYKNTGKRVFRNKVVTDVTEAGGPPKPLLVARP